MIIEFAQKYDMLPRGAKVLVALSGGADSVCLLHYLKTHEEELGISVFAAHFEHGIRGEESLRDAEFAESFCNELMVPCCVAHADVPGYAAYNSIGLEEAARLLRYDFLENAMNAMGCDRIATAHNADDNAETVLFNLTRGSAAVRGIPPVRGVYIRPLLGTERREIERYLEENNLPHVEDSSNALDAYSRNIIRHKVMPVLRELNPAAVQAFLRAAELSAADEEYITDAADNFIIENLRWNSLPRKALAELPAPVKSRVIRRMCSKSLAQKHVEAAEALLEGSERRSADLPGIKICAEQGRVFFGAVESCAPGEHVLIPGTDTEIPELGAKIRSEFTKKPEEIHDLFKTYIFKSENICGTIICTGRRPGDKLRPAGRGCTKTLKQLFLEAGFTQAERDATLVIRDDKGILAVCGLAQDERTVCAAGDDVFRIDIESIERKKDEEYE